MPKSLSHLEAVFDNEAIKEAARKIKRELDEGKTTISLPRKEIRLVQKAYRQEMSITEARTHALVATVIGNYWGELAVKASISLEGLCSYRHHKQGPIAVTEDLTARHLEILKSTDEELTDEIIARHKELQFCRFHSAPVEVEKSFLVYTPYEFATRVIAPSNASFKGIRELRALGKGKLVATTSRIKSPGGLADKLTDKILGVDKAHRRDKIASEDDEVKDLSAVRMITTDEQTCYEVLEYLKGRTDIAFPQPLKDYIKHPKGNKYRALHLIVSYNGLYHEIQIVDTSMFDFNRLHPIAGHKKYKAAIREAREEIGQEWFDLNSKLRALFGSRISSIPLKDDYDRVYSADKKQRI